MSSFTEKQKEQMLGAARKGKTIRQICEDYNLYMPSVRAFLGDAVSKKIIPPMIKERKRNYYNEPLVPVVKLTPDDKLALMKPNLFQDELIPAIKLKQLQFKSIFDVRI